MTLWYLWERKINGVFDICDWVLWEICFAGGSGQWRKVCWQLWPHRCRWPDGRMVISADLPEHVLELLPLQRAIEILVVSGALHIEALLVEEHKERDRTSLRERMMKIKHAKQLPGGHISTSSSCPCCWLLPCVSCLSPHPTVPCWHSGFFPGNKWRRLESKHSWLLSSRGYSSAESSSSSLPDHMDTNAAAGTQWFMDRTKPLERTDGWGRNWLEQTCL